MSSVSSSSRRSLLLLFKAELRRRWPPRTRWVTGSAVIVFLAVQAALTGLYVRWGLWVLPDYLSTLLGFAAWSGLWSPLAILFSPFTDQARDPRLLSSIPLGVSQVSLHLFAPVLLATTFAREKGRAADEELLLAGFSSRQILTARGSATLCPFLVLALLSLVISFLITWFGAQFAPTTADSVFKDPEIRTGWLRNVVVWSLDFLLDGVFLTVVAAASPNSRVAICLAFGWLLVVEPAVRYSLFIRVMAGRDMWIVNCIVLAIELALVVGLLPLALRRLDHHLKAANGH